MKLATYRYEGNVKVGVVSEDEQTIYPLHSFGLGYTDMIEVIRNMTEAEKTEITRKMADGEVSGTALSAVELLSPIPEPNQDVICLGINYFDHADEIQDFTSIKLNGKKEPAIYFAKRVNEAVAPYGDINGHLEIVQDLDYEVELAAIIGKDALDVPAEKVSEYIFGYAVLNDVSARTLQKTHKQWYRGKSLDGFTSIGPWIVTADEIAFPPALDIESRVNGEVRQQSNTRNMIHDLAEIVSEFSSGLTLKAGTIIATGTPSGVAMGMDEPQYLQKGDVVECSIDGIGTIRNKVD